MNPILLSSACTLYNTSPDELIPLSGGNYNAVYQFPNGKKSAILRIGVEDCPREQTLGMLDWVHFLSLNGAPVTAPLPSINSHLLENLKHYGTRYTLTAFEKAEGTLAENIPISEWSHALFHSIGRAASKLHRISAGYHPSRPAFIRPQWFDSNEIRAATDKLAATSDPAREKLNYLISKLQHLPSDNSNFGLIHDDLHFANFIIQPDGQVTIIDFDDCVYGYFVMDVAMALFDVLVLYHPSSDEDSQHFAQNFMRSYLSGYQQEHELASFWLSQLPCFLKLKELCIYATLLGHPEIDQPGTWVGRFMRGRAARIAHNIPYVDIDFAALD